MFAGESVMNDAVALVLSKSVETYDTAAGREAFDTPAFFAAVANFVGKQTRDFFWFDGCSVIPLAQHS